jgi:hypothetical protein
MWKATQILVLALVFSGHALTIISPDSNDSFEQGDTIPLTYTYASYNYYISVDLISSGGSSYTIIASTPCNGSYYFKVPDVSYGSYRIYIQDVDGWSWGYDDSEYFTIGTSSTVSNVAVDKTTYIAGDSITVTWEGGVSPLTCSLYDQLVGGLMHESNIFNSTQSYTWNLSTDYPTGSYYYVVVEDSYSSDTSYLFTIYAYQELDDSDAIGNCLSGICSPAYGSSYHQGDTLTIKWATDHFSGSYVSLYYESYYTSASPIDTSISNTGSYDWSIPENLADSDYYIISIYDSSDPSSYLESEYFEIQEEGAFFALGSLRPEDQQVVLVGVVLLGIAYYYKKRRR